MSRRAGKIIAQRYWGEGAPYERDDVLESVYRFFTLLAVRSIRINNIDPNARWVCVFGEGGRGEHTDIELRFVINNFLDYE